MLPVRQRVITQSGMPTHAALIFRAILTFATTKLCTTTCLFRSGTAALRRTRARERTRDKGSSESLRSRAFQICILPHRRRRKNILERTEGQSLGDSHDGKGALVGQRISALSQRGKERLGSFCEWFGAQHRRPAFEVSLGGQESAPLEDFNFLYNRFEEMLTLGAIM